MDDQNREKSNHEPPEQEEPPQKRIRLEELEMYITQLQQIKQKKNKEIHLSKLNRAQRSCFEKAITKEVKTNLIDIWSLRIDDTRGI